MKSGKVIIFSAPSGAGKSTIINYLREQNPSLVFSVSATSRPPREGEVHGVNYFFITREEFEERITRNEFLEYEEVYEGRFYGTLKAQVDRQLSEGKNVIFDIDVVGGCNVKQIYGSQALAVFIEPPSIDELLKRLNARNSDTEEVIKERVAKAEFELGYASRYDVIVVNDDLQTAQEEVLRIVNQFID